MKIGFLFLVLALGATNGLLTKADSNDDLSDRILQWVQEGKVQPLESLMQRYKKRLKGRLLDVEVEREADDIVYELKILRDDSVIYEIKINAKTGEWLTEEVED